MQPRSPGRGPSCCRVPTTESAAAASLRISQCVHQSRAEAQRAQCQAEGCERHVVVCSRFFSSLFGNLGQNMVCFGLGSPSFGLRLWGTSLGNSRNFKEFRKHGRGTFGRPPAAVEGKCSLNTVHCTCGDFDLRQVDVAVLGAGGPSGRLCVAEAIRRGLTVRAVVRDPAKYATAFPAGVEVVPGDVTTPQSLDPAVRGARNVVFAAAAASFFAGTPRSSCPALSSSVASPQTPSIAHTEVLLPPPSFRVPAMVPPSGLGRSSGCGERCCCIPYRGCGPLCAHQLPLGVPPQPLAPHPPPP